MKKNSPILLVMLALTLTLLAACGSSETVDVGDGDDVQDQSTTTTDARDDGGTRPTLKGLWVLDTLTVDGADVTVPDGIDMEIELGRIGGTGGCNSFGGRIDAADDGTLVLAELGWTEMACADSERMDFETTYLTALTEVDRWEASPEGISFISADVVLAYRPGQPPTTLPLEATVWTLDTIFSGEGVERAASTTDQSKPQVTVVIGDDAATLTSDDCGSIVIPLNYEPGVDGNLNVGDKELQDKPTCEDPASNMAVAIDGFWAATGYMVDESRMTLIGLSGELIGFRGMA